MFFPLGNKNNQPVAAFKAKGKNYPTSIPKHNFAKMPIKNEINATDRLIADISKNFGKKRSDLTVAI